MPFDRTPKDKNHSFTQISNSLINDKKLSLQALGLLTYLLSKPNHHYITTSELRHSHRNDDFSVKSIIKELISHGYLLRKQLRYPSGKFSSYYYHIFETPIKTTSQPQRGFPLVVKPSVVKPSVVKQPVVNNNLKIILKEVTTTLPTKVVNTNVTAPPPKYIKKKKEFIEYSKSLGVFNQESLIKKYGLDILYKNSYSFAKGIKKSDNPTGCLVTSIKENWISKPGTPDFPLLLPFEAHCNKCSMLFQYLSHKPNRTICLKCKTKGL